jgi:hypothetical protein
MSRAAAPVRWARALVVSAAVHLGWIWLLGSGGPHPVPLTVRQQSEVVVDLASRTAPVVAPPAPVVAPDPAVRGRRARRPHVDPVQVPSSLPPATTFASEMGAGLEVLEGLTTTAGVGTGPAVADGPDEGPPGGGGDALGRRARPRELVARVVGSGSDLGEVGPPGAAVVSLREATALRIRDYFPRLPAALWTDARPYIVRIGLCVSDAGRVIEAVLQSAASPTLDPLVLAAVRGWRYRPRLVDGQPQPFCHAVTISYDRAY